MGNKTFLFTLLLCAIFINLSWGRDKDALFISSETALEIVHKLPEIVFLKKQYEGDGLYVSSSTQETVKQENPVYVVDLTIRKNDKVMFSQVFYVKADTGEVSFDEKARKDILAMMEEEKAREQKEAELIEQERPFKEELERRYNEITNSRFSGGDEYIKLIQESMPLFLKSIRAVTPQIRSQGARILGALSVSPFGNYKAKEAIPGLLDLLKDKDYGIRYEAVIALGSISIGEKGDKSLIDALSPLLKDSNSLVRRGAVASLSKLGDNSLTPVFVSMLNDSSVNQEVVKAFTRIGDEQALEPLLALFDKKEWFYLEKDIVAAAANTGGPKSIPFLIGLLGKEYTHDTKYHGDFEPVTPYIGFDAAQALAKIGKGATGYLLEALKSKEYLIRLYAVYALSLIKDPSTVDPLNEALAREEDPTVRIYLQKTIAENKGNTFVQPVIDLKARVRTDKQKYNLNEDIKLDFYIENKGAIPCVINTAAIYPGIFRVIDPDGQPIVCLTEWHRSSFPAKDNLITLNPGQTYKTGPFSIRQDYIFTVPGRYQITGIYENNFNAIEFGVYAWVGKIESQAATIYVD